MFFIIIKKKKIKMLVNIMLPTFSIHSKPNDVLVYTWSYLNLMTKKTPNQNWIETANIFIKLKSILIYG